MAALAVAGVLIYPSFTPVGAIVTVTPNPRPNAQGTSMGDPNAPVKVIEFADFQCPYCRQFTETQELSIVQNYISTGKVYFTYVPDSFIGPDLVAAAEAAYCAADQGKFWEYHDMLYANQTSENSGDFSQNRLLAFGQQLGLDMTQFKSCVTANTYSQQVQQGLAQAQQAGVQATPSFTVNGKLVDASTLDQTIQQALASASK